MSFRNMSPRNMSPRNMNFRNMNFRNMSFRSSFAYDALPSAHRLTNRNIGESRVERLTRRILQCRENRVPIIYSVRVLLIETCRKIAEEKHPHELHTIHLNDLTDLRDQVCDQTKKKTIIGTLTNMLGGKTDAQNFLEVLEYAIEVVIQVQMLEDDNFYYQEFNFYHTKLQSRWPWMRNSAVNAYITIVFFYMCSPLIFCYILDDHGVCPSGEKVYGWVTALYFASTTMSTVGYGEITVQKNDFNLMCATFYMIFAMVVAITAFTAAAETVFSPLTHLAEQYRQRWCSPSDLSEPSYKRPGRIKLLIISEVILMYVSFNLLGACMAKYFGEDLDDGPEYQRTWIQSIYWAVQSTSTIGYGDIPMETEMRIFQIFYLSISPYVVGLALGKLGNMMREIESENALFAYQNRRISKHMVHYMNTDPSLEVVDQFEFFVGSLLNLEKITAEDVTIIMNKFRSLETSSVESGFICASELPSNIFLNTHDKMFKLTESIRGR